MNVRRLADAALARGIAEVRRLTIAGTAVELIVEREVAQMILAPFAHLPASTDEPVLRIRVAALNDSDAAELGLDSVPDSGAVIPRDGTIEHLHRHSAALLDRDAGEIRALIRNDGALASWHRAKPLQVPLSIFFADRGVDLVHGGLVSLRGNGLLIAGNSGSGKSTLAAASLREGFDFLGDDCVGVRDREGYSIFGSSCLVTSDDEPKTVFFPERIAASTTLRAIVLPRILRARHVTMTPASGKEALLALAPSSILKRAVPAADALARMARLARELPAFRLEMGPIAEAAVQMRELLERLGA